MGERNTTATYDTTVFGSNDVIWDNETLGIVPGQSRQKENVFLLGVTFAGGFGLGVVIHLIYYTFVRWILGRYLPAPSELELSNGVCNLAFIGDDARPIDDNPPAYSTVVQTEDDSTRTFWSRLFRREKTNNNAPQEEPPPSYFNAVEEMQRDRRTSSF